jgi:hypothetical protein
MKSFVHALLLAGFAVSLCGGIDRARSQSSDERFNDVGKAPVKKWIAGLFSFSDELGGMKIVSISGRGTLQDPVIVTQDVQTIGPSVLTVRPLAAMAGLSGLGTDWTSLHIELRTINRSEAGWIGFHLELQEEVGKASIYGDGLSFNQLTRQSDYVLSNRFANHELEYEPGDRLIFGNGWVDQMDMVDLRFFVLDLTPTPVFYIQQLPRVPSS